MRDVRTTRRHDEAIRDPYLLRILSIVQRVLETKNCQVVLFGSRANGTSTAVSDYDIAVLAAEDLSRELSRAWELLEESTIPFMVDLVDLRSSSAALKRRIEEEGILIWDNSRIDSDHLSRP